MNEVARDIRRITFDVSPIFSIYEEVCEYYLLATPENLQTMYDVRVRDRVKQFEMTYPLIEQGFPWNHMSEVSEDTIELISNHIGMRPIILESQLIDVLETYHMMYKYGNEYRNVPVMGVW